MADSRCPLCMEKLKNGECVSCGYKLPDEENISSIYDAEPSAYLEAEPAVREITPAVQMEEIYPNREEMPKFKVRDDEGKTVRADVKVNLNKKTETKTSGNVTNTNPYASNGNPYAGYTPEGVPNKSGSPFANQSVYSSSSADTETVQGFLKKYWWLLLLTFFIPLVGVILYSTMKHEIRQYKAHYLVLIALVLGIIIPP